MPPGGRGWAGRGPRSRGRPARSGAAVGASQPRQPPLPRARLPRVQGERRHVRRGESESGCGGGCTGGAGGSRGGGRAAGHLAKGTSSVSEQSKGGQEQRPGRPLPRGLTGLKEHRPALRPGVWLPSLRQKSAGGGGAPSLCPQCPGLASGGAGERQWGPDRAVPQAPDWVDAEECHRCRVQFGVVTRKVSVPVGSGGLPPPPSQPHVAPSLLVVVGDREGIPPRPHGGRGHQGLVPACCCQVPLTLPRPGAPRLGAEARASKPAGVSPPRAGGDGRRQTHQAPPARLTPFL